MFFAFIRERRWPALLGYGLFVGMMAIGYYYNLTFVQFGLLDLGTRLIGLSRQAVSVNMAYLALLTCITALAVGYWMQRSGWSEQFRVKLRLAFGVVLVQTILTAVAPFVRSQTGFLMWVLTCSLALGVGVPATFSMTVDLIPRVDRGYIAAAITALAYFMAEMLSTNWEIEQFALQLVPLMLMGVVGLGVFAFGRLAFIDELAQQHNRPEFWRGRFVTLMPDGRLRIRRRMVLLVVLMFGVYFVDSLGFLRMAETPILFQTTWQSPDLNVRLFIGVTHVIAALIAGAIYTGMGERPLLLWIFGIFGLVHFMYIFGLRLNMPMQTTLAEAMLYSTAVSLYTVLNFAIWADVSTPRTISLNASIGVALSAWTATFISTALALYWNESGVALADHLSWVDALALLFFVLMLILAILPWDRRSNGRRPNPQVPVSEDRRR